MDRDERNKAAKAEAVAAAQDPRVAKAAGKPGEIKYDEDGRPLRTDMTKDELMRDAEERRRNARPTNRPAVGRHKAHGTVSLSDDRAETKGTKPKPGEAPTFALPYGSEPRTVQLNESPKDFEAAKKQQRAIKDKDADE